MKEEAQFMLNVIAIFSKQNKEWLSHFVKDNRDILNRESRLFIEKYQKENEVFESFMAKCFKEDNADLEEFSIDFSDFMVYLLDKPDRRKGILYKMKTICESKDKIKVWIDDDSVEQNVFTELTEHFNTINKWLDLKEKTDLKQFLKNEYYSRKGKSVNSKETVVESIS